MDMENIKDVREEEAIASKELPQHFTSPAPVLIKLIELLISLLCFCLIFVPYDNRPQRTIHRPVSHHVGVVYTAFLMSIFCNLIFLVAHLRKVPTPKFITYLLSIVIGLLLLLAAYLILYDWWILMNSLYFYPQKMFLDMMICSGIFAIFGSLASFIDVYVTHKYV